MDISYVLEMQGIINAGFGEAMFYMMAEYSGNIPRHILRLERRGQSMWLIWR